jgi:hypothetical protein
MARGRGVEIRGRGIDYPYCRIETVSHFCILSAPKTHHQGFVHLNDRTPSREASLRLGLPGNCQPSVVSIIETLIPPGLSNSAFCSFTLSVSHTYKSEVNFGMISIQCETTIRSSGRFRVLTLTVPSSWHKVVNQDCFFCLLHTGLYRDTFVDRALFFREILVHMVLHLFVLLLSSISARSYIPGHMTISYSPRIAVTSSLSPTRLTMTSPSHAVLPKSPLLSAPLLSNSC